MGATANLAMQFLRGRLDAVENEKKKLDAEAQAINLLLEKHAGANPGVFVSYSSKSASQDEVHLSISKLVHKALTEAGKPQTTAQLLAFIASHGRVVAGATMRSTIHQKTKLFESVEPGVYGLVEWSK